MAGFCHHAFALAAASSAGYEKRKGTGYAHIFLLEEEELAYFFFASVESTALRFYISAHYEEAENHSRDARGREKSKLVASA